MNIFDIEFTFPDNKVIKQSFKTQEETKPNILFEVEVTEDKTFEYLNKWKELSDEEEENE